VSAGSASHSKASLRQRYRALRLAELPAAEAGLQRSATRLAELLIGEQKLGLYWPLQGEADLRHLAEHPSLLGRLALPRVADGRLLYRPWQPGDELSLDDTGIPAPAHGPNLEASGLGLLLAPALAFDAAGIRLGYGGGWFDRLRCDPLWASIPALAVLPTACLTAAIPRDGWDVPFPGWLDEQGIHWLQAV
jgi:5-formyltetrahydrofolate cyclo-ligase